ncbi:MAG: hypothetical protein ACI90V_014004 [Bacillariaceae sp.]
MLVENCSCFRTYQVIRTNLPYNYHTFPPYIRLNIAIVHHIQILPSPPILSQEDHHISSPQATNNKHRIINMESILIGAFSYCSAVLFATKDELKAIKAARAEAETDPDTASITPVCDPDDSKSSRRSVRFSNISIINITPLSPSTISTTTTTTEEEDEIINLHEVTCSLVSSPSSSVEEYVEVKTSQSLSPPSLPAQLRSAPQHQHQHQHQQNRHRFLGHKNRRRRVRKLLKEDIAHRRRKEEEYENREEKILIL